MTIYRSHPDCQYCKKLWNWQFLDECFTNNIRVTDIDGFVERRDHYLVIETKGSGVPIPKGQQRMIESMHRSGCITVLVAWGEPQHPERIDVYHPKKERRTHEPASILLFQQIAKRWYNYANTEPPLPRQADAKIRDLITAFRRNQEHKPHKHAPVWGDRVQQASLIPDELLPVFGDPS